MNKKSTQYKEINKFLSSFTIVQHSQGATILVSQNNTYLIRNIEISSSEEQQKQRQLNEIITTLSTHQSFNCKNILPLINFDIFFNKSKTQSQIRAIYHHGRKPLSKEIEQRKGLDEHFDQDALWSLLYSLVTPLAYLQQKSIIYGVLDASRVFLDSDVIAIMDPSSTGVDPYEIMGNRFYSPELIKSQENSDQINMFKSDVFVLGLLMLQCALLKTQLYDYDQNILQQCLAQIKDSYSVAFCDLIESFLNSQPQQRPSFQQIIAHINEMFEISTSNNENLEANLPDQEDEPNQICHLEELCEKQHIDILQTQYIRFQDHYQNSSSIDLEKDQFPFNQSNSQLSDSPINQNSQFSQNSSLFIDNSIVKQFQKSRRAYKPKQIKQKLIRNDDNQSHSSHNKNQQVQEDFFQIKVQSNQNHRRTKTDNEPNLQNTKFHKKNKVFNDIKPKQFKQNQSHGQNFPSGAAFSPLNKENLFTKPEILDMIKHDRNRAKEREKKFSNINFSYIPQNQKKNFEQLVNNQQKEQKTFSNHRKVQSFHQVSLNSHKR